MKTKLMALVHGEYVSHTVKVLEIAKAFRKTNNYDIIFSGTGDYMKMVEEAGFNWIETPTLPKDEISGVLKKKLVPSIYTEENVNKYYKIELDLIEKHKPDIILRDHFREMAGIVAKQKRIFDVFIQLASCCPYYHLDFRISKAPRILGVFLPQEFIQALRKKMHSYYRKKVYKPILNQVKKIGIRVDKNIHEGCEADLVLLADEEKLFPLKDLRENYKFIGVPLSFDNYPYPEWLELFIKDPRKKILVTGGTTGEHEKPTLFVDTFKDKKYAVALFTNEKNIFNGFYGGNNFDISKVLPYVDVFITHGGLGVAYTGLKYGVPILSMPNHFEQEINSAQLEKIGAGIFLYPDRVSPKNIKKNLEKILTDKSFKENAVAFSKIMTKDPLKLAVKYIEEGYKKFKKN